MYKTLTITLALSAVAVSNAQFVDTFDTIDPAWVTDRYDPAGFAVENFMGDNRLKISISTADAFQNRPAAYQSNFYNTHGKQRPGGLQATQWTVSADLYVSTAMLSSSHLWRSDLWTRDNAALENDAWYGILGGVRNDVNDPFNEGAAGITNRWRVWDSDTANGWVDLGTSMTSGWHNLKLVSNGASASYYLDNTFVYTDADATWNLGEEALKTVFLQAYSFGDATHMPSAGYDVYWDNLKAVPEPSTLAIAGLGIAAFFRRKRA